MYPNQQTLLHLLLLLVLPQTVFSIPLPENTPEDHDSRTVQAINTLQRTWYNQSTGLWAHMWWNSANCLTTIANYHGTEPVETSFINSAEKIYQTTFQGGLNLAEPNTHKIPGSWTNDFYDDEAWWALTWIQVYDVTANATYLDAARTIYKDMKANLNQNSCGGLPWQRGRDTHSSIENALYLDTAAKLASRDQYRWFISESQLLSTAPDALNNSLILDNLNETTCAPTTGANQYLWTYNQGATIGALISLASAHPKEGSAYLDLAQKVADAAITYFSQGGSVPRPETGAEGGEGGAEAQGSQLKSRMGILTEACDPTCDGNTAQFKGVFVRNLARLYLARPNENGELKVFLERNARSIWERARAGGGGEREERGFPQEARLGSDWLGPYSAVDAEGEDVSATAMCSGLDGLVAAAAAVVVVAGNANNS